MTAFEALPHLRSAVSAAAVLTNAVKNLKGLAPDVETERAYAALEHGLDEAGPFLTGEYLKVQIQATLKALEN